MRPVLLVIAGPNGSGKTTITARLRQERYARSLANLPAAIRIADRVYVYDNSVEAVEARLCARTEDGSLRKVYGDLPAWVGDAVEGLPRHPQFVDLRAA